MKNGDGTFTLTHTDRSQHLFDANGRLTALRDRHHNTLALTYTGNDLTLAQAAGGQTLTFGYTNGKLTSVVDNANHTLSLTWNNNQLKTFEFQETYGTPQTYVTALTYSGGHLATITDPRLYNTTITYDAAGRAYQVTRDAT